MLIFFQQVQSVLFKVSSVFHVLIMFFLLVILLFKTDIMRSAEVLCNVAKCEKAVMCLQRKCILDNLCLVMS